MRISVTCVYWTLLFISVASSALLFIIVASESAQANYYSSFKSNQTLEAYDHELDSIEHDDLELPNIAIVKVQDPTKLATSYKDNYYQDKFPKESTNFETVIKGDRKSKDPYGEPDVAESFTPQPNLSQGISESGEATVLTLVDTTTTELQGLVEPRFNAEYTRAQKVFANISSSLTKNVNIQQKTVKDEQEISPSTQVPSLPNIDEITEESNESNVFGEESLLLRDTMKNEAVELEEVVVVRAEQSPIITGESEFSLEEEVTKILPDEMPKIEEILATTSELSDTATKAQLVEHNRDEAAAVIFKDGIMSVRSTDPHEEIPSFNEWTQKRLEEAEKKKMHPNASVQNSGAPPRGAGGMKVRSKNYASPDCGAKIVAANPEARSARSVLVSTRDEYMLNTCTSRIWFVVELCEAIQAKKIELANFELFSSSPKDFSVYISDRFPTRDWSLVGQFTAKDIKDTQSFALQPHLFGKFIKVELHTYYGSEHFCPISLFRAYGTSEFEVLETETESQISRNTNINVDDDEDSDEEEVLDVENGEAPRNLFGSARDAVLSIVKKAAEVLVKSSDLTGNNITKIQQSIDSGNILDNSFVSCTTPRYTILCDNCSDQKFARIFQLVSCREQQLNKLLKIDIVNRTLHQGGFCTNYGVKFEASAKRNTEHEMEKMKGTIKKYKRSGGKVSSMKNFQLTFLTSVFKPEYIAALCNVLAIKERKMVMNTSYEVLSGSSKDFDKEDQSRKSNEDYANEGINSFQHISASYVSTSNADDFESVSSRDLPNEEADKFADVSIEPSINSESLASQIKPTETIERDEVTNDSATTILKSSKDSNEETPQAEIVTTTPLSLHIGQHPGLRVVEETSTTSDISLENSHQTTVSSPVVTIENTEFLHNDVLPDGDTSEFSGSQSKIEKVERPDQEERHKQTETFDQEIKLSSQDSLTFDSLLSDLKDFEGENIQHEPAANPSIAQSAANSMPQKESVFLRLSNRIKALERNMSLSGQYLEELSRRYKKQVEEMQRSLERTVSAINEKTRKWEDRESKRAEEIALLREDIASLSKSVKNLLYDRDSWHGKLLMIGQHLLLICSEVFVIFLVLLYCRGTRKSQEKGKEQLKKDAMRRKSAENFSSHIKKTKKRRPSEIASTIAGTYHDLMIDDKSYETKKGRKKKRKKEMPSKTNANNVKRNLILHCKSVPNAASDDVNIVSRKSSSVEVLRRSDSQSLICRRPKSVPENTIDWFDNCDYEAESNVQLMLESSETCEMKSVQGSDFSSYSENITKSNSLPVSMSLEKVTLGEQTAAELEMGVLNSTDINVNLGDDKQSQSSFMRTALSARKRRKFQSHDVNGKSNNSVEQKQHLNYSDAKSAPASPTTSELYPTKICSDNSTTNGLLVDQSDESRCINNTSLSRKKDRKNTTFRKMSRR